ncbi:MAG: hypothetical protein M3530_09055 [Thermoproteota archaeon]|nr:hypothetical protein [Thermoproteota archaeon]
MTEEDHQTIYEKYSLAPSPDQVIGKWMVNWFPDGFLTPLIQIFTYARDNLGKLHMEYTFARLLNGIKKFL